MSKKVKASKTCQHCDLEKTLVCCEDCYEQSRKVLLDEVARRDLIITQLRTQISLQSEVVKHTAEANSEAKRNKRKTA